MRPGPKNCLTDVVGLRVGHAVLAGVGALSGTTVVLAPPGGAVGGVDVRGAAPGTRETDLLDPRNTMQRMHAVVFSGGSAFGLAAADGVMAALEAAGIGFTVPGGVVPIVPAAVLFDLGRGGDFARRPDAATGAAAYDAARGVSGDEPVLQGAHGAGAGALCGGLRGGIGTASVVLRDGATVAALVVVNAAGSAVDPTTGELHGVRHGVDNEFPRLRPDAAGVAALRAAGSATDSPVAGAATTLAVVATDVALDKAGCARLAAMGHDGLARALDPIHTVVDGDTVFALSTATRPAPGLPELAALQAAAARAVSRAVAHALLTAETVMLPVGTYRSYRDVAFGSRPQ